MTRSTTKAPGFAARLSVWLFAIAVGLTTSCARAPDDLHARHVASTGGRDASPTERGHAHDLLSTSHAVTVDDNLSEETRRALRRVARGAGTRFERVRSVFLLGHDDATLPHTDSAATTNSHVDVTEGAVGDDGLNLASLLVDDDFEVRRAATTVLLMRACRESEARARVVLDEIFHAPEARIREIGIDHAWRRGDTDLLRARALDEDDVATQRRIARRLARASVKTLRCGDGAHNDAP